MGLFSRDDLQKELDKQKKKMLIYYLIFNF